MDEEELEVVLSRDTIRGGLARAPGRLQQKRDARDAGCRGSREKNDGEPHSCIAAFYVGLLDGLPENSSGVV